MKGQFEVISTEEDQYNTTLYESSLTLTFSIDGVPSTLSSTLYNYGITSRQKQRQFQHFAAPFPRFFLFESAGGILEDGCGTEYFLRPGQRYIITSGHPFFITYLPGSLYYHAHFGVQDWTGQQLFRHAPLLLEFPSPDDEMILRHVWKSRYAGGVLAILAQIQVEYLHRDWKEFHSEYELYSKFQVLFPLLKTMPPAQLRVEALAEAMNMARAAFSRSFSSTLGITPKEFLRQYYLSRAGELLCHSGASIAKIAHMLGHNDTHNFFHVFKRITGMTPAEYRRTRRKTN